MSNAITLSSLAMLKVSIDNGKDYLEYLKPYVIQVLVEAPPEVVIDTSIAAQLRNQCGLEIPHRTVHIVLQRLAREGYRRKASGVYTIIKELPATDNSAARAAAARHITAINKALVLFAKESANREITEEVTTECLIAFLSQFSIPCLKSYLRGTTLPSVNHHDDWQIVLVSQFINGLTSNPELFDSFMTLVQGHMLANALLCPDLNSVASSYKDVIFYFDTRLLIQFLGLEGEQEKQAIMEVIGLVQRLEGRIAYFSHTFDELVGVINGAANHIDSPKGRGTIVGEARKSGMTKSDLFLIAQNASERLAEANIVAVQTPPYLEKTHKFEISEEVFGTVLDDEVNYLNPRAKDYDIRSVRSVYILRRGIIPYSIEKSLAVLVTNNTKFSKAAYEYGKNYEQSREVSTVITDFSLANTAWLKAPQGAPSLPRKEVLAFAYATIQPTTDFWGKVLVEADKLEASGKISTLDHQLLRSSHHVQSELMKLTLGEDIALTEESITTTLRRVSTDIRKDESDRLQRSEVARIETEKQLAQQIAQNDDIKKAIFWSANQRAGREALALSTLIWISQIAIAIFGVVKIPESSIFGGIVVVIAVLTGAVRLASTHWDIKPLKARVAFTEWRRAKLLKNQFIALSIKG